MTASEPPTAPRSPQRHYDRDSPEFGRVANLSDGVFAIAMTLLVLGLEVPTMGEAPLAALLRERIPNLVAFVLGFVLVANMWLAHHKFVSQLGSFEPGLIRLNLLFLGAAALVPFPTGLIGVAPHERAAVLPFIVLFIVLNGVFLAMIARAHSQQAWRWPLSATMYRWVRFSWLAALAGMALALLVALWIPVGGLVVATLHGVVSDPVIARRAPRGYSDWP